MAQVILHIGEQETTFRKMNDGTELHLPAGSRQTADSYFRHNPPTESEVEESINQVEDQLMKLTSTFKDKDYQLVSADPQIREIAHYANITNDSLSIQEMEAVFSRLAMIIRGRPAATDTLPLTGEFAASLLILREVMHHLGFSHIQLIAHQK